MPQLNWHFSTAPLASDNIGDWRLATLLMTSALVPLLRCTDINRDSVMGKDRLAAFSDGVIAIIITIMVLELKVPHGSDWTALMAVTPSFLSYVLSFIYLAIYWNNHHHLLHTVTRVNGLILWANSFLLFWLSLIPAATAWMGENFLVPIPAAFYGGILFMPAIAYYLLQKAILRKQGSEILTR